VFPALIPNTSDTSCPRINGLSICTIVRDATGNLKLGLWAELLLGVPLQIIGIVLLGLLTRFVVFRVVDRVTEGIASGSAGLGRFDRLPSATALLTTSPLLSARREQRARTMGSVLKSVTTITMTAVVVLMSMQVLGFPIAPLLTGAGIVGVALGFGSQALVKDYLSGIFMIAEDQYGVGDVVDLGDASGVVEAVGLRVTRLRDTEGTVWYLRNGQILRVGNRSQGWARAVLDIGIAYDQDVSRAQNALLDVARGLQSDPTFENVVLEDPEVWGIESFTAEGVVLRLVAKTQPLEQWRVARELRRRIKDRFDADEIRVAYPPGPAAEMARNGRGQRNGGGSASAAKPAKASSGAASDTVALPAAAGSDPDGAA
jgi:small-conductance mechanosensitive channel